MWKARSHQHFMEAQHAQSGRLANGVVFNKVLGFDIIRQLKKTLVSGDVDAVGCYDRIIPPPSMMACRRLGIPKLAAKMITTILNNIIYRLRTRHGLSART